MCEWTELVNTAANIIIAFFTFLIFLQSHSFFKAEKEEREALRKAEDARQEIEEIRQFRKELSLNKEWERIRSVLFSYLRTSSIEEKKLFNIVEQMIIDDIGSIMPASRHERLREWKDKWKAAKETPLLS
jgi:hypothetical protein